MWMDNIKEWTKISYNDCIRVAQDRARWWSMTASRPVDYGWHIMMMMMKHVETKRKQSLAPWTHVISTNDLQTPFSKELDLYYSSPPLDRLPWNALKVWPFVRGVGIYSMHWAWRYQFGLRSSVSLIGLVNDNCSLRLSEKREQQSKNCLKHSPISSLRRSGLSNGRELFEPVGKVVCGIIYINYYNYYYYAIKGGVQWLCFTSTVACICHIFMRTPLILSQYNMIKCEVGEGEMSVICQPLLSWYSVIISRYNTILCLY